MYRNGRDVDDVFDPLEQLYQRFEADALLDRIVLPQAFRFPKQSVNRSKFSIPEWVLFDEEGRYDGFGVLAYTPANLPKNLSTGDGTKTFLFFPKHDPLEDNYSHSEIWHSPNPPHKPNDTIKRQFRNHMSQNSEIVIMPKRP